MKVRSGMCPKVKTISDAMDKFGEWDIRLVVDSEILLLVHATAGDEIL